MRIKLDVPVLMYHEIYSENKKDRKFQRYSSCYITLDQFEEQMSYLSINNYKTLSSKALLRLVQKNKKYISDFLKKVVIITFDDGYIGNYTHAYPIMRKYNMNAIIFVIVNRIGTEGFMSWNQLQELRKNGIDVQSHTMSHRPLEMLSSDHVILELINSKGIIEKKLDTPVKFLSYPQGSYNAKIQKIAREVGFEGGFTSDIGYLNYPIRPFRLNRIEIRQRFNISDFIKIVTKAEHFYQKQKLLWLFKNKFKKIIGIENYLKIYIKINKIQDNVLNVKVTK